MISMQNQPEDANKSTTLENRPPLNANYQPDISPLANYASSERARSAQQPLSKGTYDDEPNDMMEDDPTGGYDRH